MPAGRQRSMASINVNQKGEELYRASYNGKKDEVKAMIKALSPREEWTQVLNWQGVSTANPGCKKPGILSEAQRASFLGQFWRSGGPTWGFLAPIPS